MTCAPAAVLLCNGLLIDGTGAAAVPDAAVLVEDGRVRWAGPGEPPDFPVGTRRIDVLGDAILPGFIDCHVHVSGAGNEISRLELAAMPTSLRTLATVRWLQLTLFAGVTTVRDLAGADAGHRRAVESGVVIGPRMQIAVAMLSPTGGHGDFRMAIDNGSNAAEVSRLADGVAECRQAVREVLREGADWVKVAATGGVGSPTDQPDDEGFLEDEIRTIVEIAAGHRGKRVAAHAQGRRGILNAVRAGVASIEHGYEVDDEIIDLMRARGTFLVPTLTTMLKERTEDSPPWSAEKKARWQKIGRDHLPRAIERGVRIAMGTDCGIANHGTNLCELGHLVDFGMTPMDAIRSGTSEAAELLGLQGEIGTLEPGKRADIVVARGNPLTDIHSLGKPENVLLVMKGGVIFKALDHLAE